MSDRLKAAMDKRQKAVEELNKEVSAVLSEEFKTVFEEFPTLTAFGWRQYTQYWNDGDTCDFSVHCDEECILTQFNDEDSPTIGYDREPIEKYNRSTGEYDPVEAGINSVLANKVADKVSEIINKLPSDSLEAFYGDHVEVLVSRYDVRTEEYTDHD